MAKYFKKDALYCARFGHNSESLVTFTFNGNNDDLVTFLKKQIPKHFGETPIIRNWGSGKEKYTSHVAEWDDSTKQWIEKDIAWGDEKYQKAFRIQGVSLPEKGETYTAVQWSANEKQVKFSFDDDNQKTIAWLKAEFPTHTDEDLIAMRMGVVCCEHGDSFYHFLVWENGKWGQGVYCDDDSKFNNAIMIFYESE